MDENKKDMLEEELEAVTPDNASAIDEDLIENTAEAEEAVDEAIEEVADDADKAEDAAEEITEEAEKPAKKKFFLQTPVIIALCLVVAALLGYFTYVAFFLREPEGVTWTAEIDGLTYYIDFNSDNTFKAYVGSVEVDGTYSKAKDQPKPNYTGATVDETLRVSTITLDYQIAYFYPNYAAEYEITGSRILGNQVCQALQGSISLEKGIPDCVDGTNQATLHYLQGKGDMDVLALGCFGLAGGKVFSDGIVEFLLFRGKLVGYGLGVALLVQRFSLPVLHVLLQAPDKVLVDAALADLLDAGCRQVWRGEDILVQQLHQALEGVSTPTVWSCSQKKDVLTLFGKRECSFVATGQIAL